MSTMPVGRITEICSGHKCWSPTIAISGSSNVFVENLPVHRVGDIYVPHCCGDDDDRCHDVKTTTASPSVFTNDRATSHIGSNTDCDEKNIMITGSARVWIEGF